MAMQAVHGETQFNVGDTVDVHYRLIEKEKVAGKAKKEVKEEVRERIQIFEGIVISIRGMAENMSFTVRKMAIGNIGVERIFPLASPWIKKITVKKKSSVRRAKLYYLRDKTGQEGQKLKEKASKTPKPNKKTEKPAAHENKK